MGISLTMPTGRHRRRVIPATFAGVTPRPNDRCGQQKLQVRKCRVVACAWFPIFFCGSPPMNTNVTDSLPVSRYLTAQSIRSMILA